LHYITCSNQSNIFLFITGAEDPTYLKKGTVDNIVVGVATAGLFFGGANILRGLYNMSYGINKL
jgi:hypothetical protein